MAFYRKAQPVGLKSATYLAVLAERIDGKAKPLQQHGSGLDPPRVRALRDRRHCLLKALSVQLRSRAERVIEAHGDRVV